MRPIHFVILFSATLLLFNVRVVGIARAASTGKPDADMQEVLDALKALGPKPIPTLTPAEARTQPSPKDAVLAVLKKHGKPTTPEKVAKVEDRTIPGGKGELPARIYTPAGKGPFPLVVYYHGGGFVIADLDTYDASTRALANAAKAVVVSVNYREAPEHPFPAPADDAVAAFRWVHDNAATLDGDPTRIAVAGESAGANLATVVARRQVQDKGIVPIFQLLVYPFVSVDLTTSSHVANGGGDFIISNDAIAWFWKNYLGAGWKTEKRSLALPSLATSDDLKGLPPAFIITAGLDPLMDEGQAYAAALKAAGVAVEQKNYSGVTHEFFGMGAVVKKAKAAESDAGKALKKGLAAKH